MSAPEVPSMMNYYSSLAGQVGDASMAAFAQNAKSHTKARLTEILRILSRTGHKLGGITGSKQVLAERLAKVLAWVLDAGRQTPSTKEKDDGSDSSDGENAGASESIEHFFAQAP